MKAMDDNRGSRRNRRVILALSGTIDIVIGAALLLSGLGLLPVRVSDWGLPSGVALVVGAVVFIGGAVVAVYNYSRLDE